MSELHKPALFRYFPQLEESVPWVSIIPQATPVQPMKAIGSRWGHNALYVKREDSTDSVYGGNKVRNLEFLIGEAIERRATKLVTIAPLGSNFIAALAAQARKFKLPVEVHHFVPVRSPQIEAHSRFIASQGASLQVHDGVRGTVPAGMGAASSLFLTGGNEHPMWISPGGSNVRGALGHANALVEFLEQVEDGQSPLPETIVVGAGTCGTMAGLTAAIRALGLNIRLVGVRCVDRIVCNQGAVARLANATLKKLGFSQRVTAKEIELVDYSNDLTYGKPLQEVEETMRLFEGEEGIRLDTTYTSKVITKMAEMVTQGALKQGPALYWHTFSSQALVH